MRLRARSWTSPATARSVGHRLAEPADSSDECRHRVPDGSLLVPGQLRPETATGCPLHSRMPWPGRLSAQDAAWLSLLAGPVLPGFVLSEAAGRRPAVDRTLAHLRHGGTAGVPAAASKAADESGVLKSGQARAVVFDRRRQRSCYDRSSVNTQAWNSRSKSSHDLRGNTSSTVCDPRGSVLLCLRNSR